MKKDRGLAWIAVLLAAGCLGACARSPEKGLPPTEARSQWNDTIDKQIPDPQRASKLKQLGQQLVELQNSISRDIAGLNEKAVALNANHEANKEEAQQLVAAFFEKRNSALAQYRDIIFAMRREVSAEEWKALMK
jgi:predicted  nucleic acid-binding Zn-ribbon protein